MNNQINKPQMLTFGNKENEIPEDAGQQGR